MRSDLFHPANPMQGGCNALKRKELERPYLSIGECDICRGHKLRRKILGHFSAPLRKYAVLSRALCGLVSWICLGGLAFAEASFNVEGNLSQSGGIVLKEEWSSPCCIDATSELIAAGFANRLAVWEVTSQTLLCDFPLYNGIWPKEFLNAAVFVRLVFPPDQSGPFLLSAHRSGTFRVWDIKKKRLTKSMLAIEVARDSAIIQSRLLDHVILGSQLVGVKSCAAGEDRNLFCAVRSNNSLELLDSRIGRLVRRFGEKDRGFERLSEKQLDDELRTALLDSVGWTKEDESCSPAASSGVFLVSSAAEKKPLLELLGIVDGSLIARDGRKATVVDIETGREQWSIPAKSVCVCAGTREVFIRSPSAKEISVFRIKDGSNTGVVRTTVDNDTRHEMECSDDGTVILQTVFTDSGLECWVSGRLDGRVLGRVQARYNLKNPIQSIHLARNGRHMFIHEYRKQIAVYKIGK